VDPWRGSSPLFPDETGINLETLFLWREKNQITLRKTTGASRVCENLCPIVRKK